VPTNKPTRSNTIIWIICGIMIIAGLGLAIHGILNLNKANVIVEWTTASELDTVGFYLLRAETPDGPFEQVNAGIIPSTSDSLTGNNYSYEDLGVVSGTTYYYMLEEVENTGQSNQHGPIIVEANSPARSELLIAALLIIGAVVYAVILLREPKKQTTATTKATP
jgi:hypothetical protein